MSAGKGGGLVEKFCANWAGEEAVQEGGNIGFLLGGLRNGAKGVTATARLRSRETCYSHCTGSATQTGSCHG